MKNLHMMATPSSSTVAVAWESDSGDARFHVWLEVKDGGPVTPYRVDRSPHANHKFILYKNPAAGLDRYNDAYFPTRYLDATAASNAPTIAKALAEAEASGMLAATLAAHAQAEAEKAAALLAEMAEATRRAMLEFSGVPQDRVPTAGITTPELVAMVALYATDEYLVKLATAIRMAR